MRFYKMRRYEQLVFRTTPDSLLEWLDGELEKRGIDSVYTHCILSILQEDSVNADPDEYIDARNYQKVYRKLESLYSTPKSKHQKWKSYSKQILLTSSIPCFDVGIDNRERKNKIAAINCLKSVSDDNTIEELIDEVCTKLKNIRNIIASEKKESLKNTNEIDKDTAFYIPPSSPTDQVEKYFADFPPLERKKEENIDSNHIAHLKICYANCIRQSKNKVQDIFINTTSIQNSNSKNKKSSYGSLKSIENIYQPDNSGKTLKYKLAQLPDHNANNMKFVDENGYSGTPFNNCLKFEKKSSAIIRNSEIQKYSEKSCSKISKSKNMSHKSRNFILNKSNHRSEKESDSKRKSALNLKMYSNPKKAKNSTETYFSSNKFSILMEEETCELAINTEECLGNATIGNLLKSEKKLEGLELISNPCKKFKNCKNPNASEDTFSNHLNEKDKIVECISETSLPFLSKYNCDKEKQYKDNFYAVDGITLEMHAEKRKSGNENNLDENLDDISPCKKLSTQTKYFKCITKAKRKKEKSKTKIKDISKSNFDSPKFLNKSCHSEKVINEDSNVKSTNDWALKLFDCNQGETEKFHASKTELNISDFFLQATKRDNLSISCFIKMKKNVTQCSFLKVNSMKENLMTLCKENKITSSDNIPTKALCVNREISSTDKTGTSYVSLYFPIDDKSVDQQNFTYALANISSIIIGNNSYYKFNIFKALNYFSPYEIFNIITVGDSNEVNEFLKKFSDQSNFTIYKSSSTVSLPDEKTISESCFYNDSKVSDSLSLSKYSDSCLESAFSTKRQLSSIFSIDFQPVKFRDNKISDTEFSEEFLPVYSQEKEVEYEDNTPAVLDHSNYKFLNLNEENSCFSSNLSSYDNLYSKSSFAANTNFSIMLPNRLLDEDNFYFSNEFHNVKSKYSVLDNNKDVFQNYSLSTQFLKENTFQEIYFSEKIDPENKFRSLLENTHEAVNTESISSFSLHSAFRRLRKNELPGIDHKSIRCEQNLLKKVTNIDRIIQKINAHNQVNSFLTECTSLKLSHTDQANSLLNSFGSSYNSYSNDIRLDSVLSFDSGIVASDLSSYNSVSVNWSQKYTNSEESLRAIWEDNNNPIRIKENNFKPVLNKSIYAFDNFYLESFQNDLKKDDDEVLKTVCSVSDSKDGIINEQVIHNSVFKSSCNFSTNSKLESLEKSVEDFPGIYVPMSDVTAKTVSKISDNSNLGFSVSDIDSVGAFNVDNCMNTIHSRVTCSDTNYTLNMKDKAYHNQLADFNDLSAFRGPYGSYSESKTNYLVSDEWNSGSGDFILESGAFHHRSSSLHELETTEVDDINDCFQHECLDQQQLPSENSETVRARLPMTRLPFANARRRVKHRFPPSKRPCAFYMEGNCSRTDCKYSHDLSNTTCRFWMGGSCFKGSTCPFLHGYVERQKIDHHNFNNSEPLKNYSLDSEVDFPSLSSVKCEKTLASKSSPVDIVCAKGLKNSR